MAPDPLKTISTSQRYTVIINSSANGIHQIIDAILPVVSLAHSLGDLNQLINRVRNLAQTTAPNGMSRDDGFGMV